MSSVWEALGAMFGLFAQFFRIFEAFWTRLTPSLFFGTLFFLDFDRLLVDFGWISGRFGDGFLMVFLRRWSWRRLLVLK